MEVLGEVIAPLQLIHISWDTPLEAVIITPLKANGDAAYRYQTGIPRLCIDEPSGASILGLLR